MNNNMLTRDEVLLNAVEDCYREMFAKAQPEADWDNLIYEKKAGKIDEDKDGPVYNRHYLSYEEYTYIINKYLEAYKIPPEWEDDINILKEYLIEGGSKDKYFEEHTDENGDYHPGYRGYEDVPPLKKHIKDIIAEYYVGYDKTQDEIAEKVTNKVIELINTCQNFYSFNIDEQKFRNTLALGATPTSNKETVKKWWKDHYDVDIEIKDRNPLLLWEYDYYGDSIDEVMKEEDGEDWEKIWWKKYEEKKAQEEAGRKALLEELKKEGLQKDINE